MARSTILSREERERIVADYESGRRAPEVAAAFGVSVRTVYRLAQLRRETGSLALETYKCGRKQKLSPEEMEKISDAIMKEPTITMKELVDRFHLPYRATALHYVIARLGFTRQWQCGERQPKEK